MRPLRTTLPTLLTWLLGAHAAYTTFRLVTYYMGRAGTGRQHVEAAWFILVALGGALGLAIHRTTRCSAGLERRTRAEPGAAVPAWWWLPLFVGVSCLAYLPALSMGLLSDDFVLLARAEAGRIWTTSGVEFFRPVPLLLWRAIAAVSADPAFALHLVNVLLHGMNAWLVLVLARSWIDDAAAPVAALLFLLFPAHVEAVAWASGIQDVIMTTAVLGALVLCVRSVSGAIDWIALGLIASIGLLSKETAVVLPALVALVFLVRPRPLGRSDVAAFLVVSILSATYLSWRLVALPPPSSYTLPHTRHALKEFIVRPLAALGSPWSSSLLEAAVPLALLWALTLVALTVHNMAARRGVGLAWRRGGLAIAFVLVSAAPLGSTFFVGPQLEGARYLYLPSVGWVMAATSPGRRSWLLAAPAVRRIVGATGLACLAASAIGLRAHLAPWREAGALTTRVVEDAVRIVIAERCERPAFAGAPDSVSGAYVFRNGLREALAARGIESADEGRADCRFTWSAEGWARTPSP